MITGGDIRAEQLLVESIMGRGRAPRVESREYDEPQPLVEDSARDLSTQIAQLVGDAPYHAKWGSMLRAVAAMMAQDALWAENDPESTGGVDAKKAVKSLQAQSEAVRKFAEEWEKMGEKAGAPPEPKAPSQDGVLAPPPGDNSPTGPGPDDAAVAEAFFGRGAARAMGLVIESTTEARGPGAGKLAEGPEEKMSAFLKAVRKHHLVMADAAEPGAIHVLVNMPGADQQDINRSVADFKSLGAKFGLPFETLIRPKNLSSFGGKSISQGRNTDDMRIAVFKYDENAFPGLGEAKLTEDDKARVDDLLKKIAKAQQDKQKTKDHDSQERIDLQIDTMKANVNKLDPGHFKID